LVNSKNISKYERKYLKGWDVARQSRHEELLRIRHP